MMNTRPDEIASWPRTPQGAGVISGCYQLGG